MTPRQNIHSRMRQRYTIATVAVAAVTLVAALSGGAATRATAAAPTNITKPTISGSAVQGQTLIATDGTWAGDTPITFAYQWLRCDTTGSNCAAIVDQIAAHLIVSSGDVGSTLRIQVTATNSSGSFTTMSVQTAKVAAGPAGLPVNTKEPSIAGTATVGQSLTLSPGSWTGTTPITFTYQWVRCDTTGGDCVSISGGSSTTYKVDAADVGFRLRADVVAKNSSGSTAARANATNIVSVSANSGPPKNATPPTISGAAMSGQTLTASSGTWTGKTPITFADQWYRCAASGSNCNAITGEIALSHKVTTSDVGFRLKVRVVATNSVGSTSADSATTNVITSSGPSLPPGAITLPDGKISIPATSVPADQRLIVDTVQFSPNPVSSRTTPIQVRVHVVDTRGYVVRDVLVFIRSVPILTSTPPEGVTAQDGSVTFQMLPRADFPLRSGHSVQFFVRARRTGDNPLAGISTRRLVQVRTTG